ncbi:GNAT family N-acetyltransferase [Radiobacillus deserti]|uniref:GNAT family N-acetyltransferase n=1 Tax=Radiobacillus deserti TaxID=2594883 RepID=A0A516KEV8_9BACI|nr:GNAT family N-acetyltransferase [Radiobacillus deserti]
MAIFGVGKCNLASCLYSKLNFHSFCIHPTIEGNGYGDQLLRFVEELALNNHYNRFVWMDSPEMNVPSIL